jgi:CrcB protein
MTRFWVGSVAARLMGDTFPWGTLAVNVIGSAFIGFFAALSAPEGRLLAPVPVRAFVMVGICGGFTTFSSFSLETLNLVRDGQVWRAGLNIAGTLLGCLIGVWAGSMAATALNQR